MAAMKKSDEDFDEEFDWIRIKSEINESKVAEVGMNKFVGRMLQNPFVPIGCISTVTALVLGFRQFYKNDHRKQQLYMRARVGAQGFTIFALLGGVFYNAFKS